MTFTFNNPHTSILVQRVEFAHTLRGLAALLVLISHFLGVFWSNPSTVGSLLNAPALFIAMPSYFAPLHFSTQFNYGSFGVAVFFLISGFVIPFSLAGLSCRGFLIARCLRIYPVYIMSLVISVIVIGLMGVYVSEKPFPYSFQHVVAQMFLVRGWLWLPSIDGLSWTLEIEIVFYLVAAAMSSFIVGSKVKKGGGLISYVLIVPILCILGVATLNHLNGFQQTVMLYATYALPFTIFMYIGTFFYLHLRQIIGSATLVLGVIACIFGFSISLAAHPALKALATSSYLLAVIVFAVFYFAKDSFKPNRILDALADISYPLYAVHAISGYGLMYILVAKRAPPWFAAISAFTMAMVLACLLHWIVELPTMRYGKQLAKKLFPKDSSIHG